ncbi:MAG: hypothetical protein IMF06_10870 [Proteobacteria bacterium]|nr:hypothetical protein [Pseudomonadota bacterium]
MIAVLVLLSLITACSSTEPRPLEPDNSAKVSYEGFWELNLGKSDNIQARLDTLVRELVRRAERQAQGKSDRGGGMAIGGSGSNSAPSIIGLAKMADLVTRSQLLEVEQDKNSILIKREDNFALTCEFYKGSSQPRETPYGTEVCGWDSHQLLFRMYLPDGLSIQHRLSLGASGDRLNIATTIYSDKVSYPFTLNRVYSRYDPDKGGIRCEMTLTRGKVCTTEAR